MNLINLSHLSFSAGTHKIVDDISFAMQPGEFVGLIGPNGAGKTTLLKIIAGIHKPQSGAVNFPSIDSLSLESNGTKNRAKLRAQFMGYLAQSEKPAWPLSVENLVALGRIPHSVYAEEKIEQALRDTETEHLRKNNLFELSGGELQRVLLARVFAGEPKVIVADEPIAALDIYHQLHVMELLSAHAKKGGAVVSALHDLSLAARFCSRLILLNHGKIVADGEPAQVLTNENIQQVYKVKTMVECRENAVLIIPHERV